MEETEYYIPEMEELFIGYECELKVSDGSFIKTKITKLLSSTTIDSNTLRTKYLSKADIESLGWKIYDKENYKKENWFLTINKTQIEILEINETFYKGECKSINELKTLMKWLGIK